MNLSLPDTASHLINHVESIVSPVYLVGGSVRDLLLGNEPHDYDFTTPLSPDDIEAAVRRAGKRPYLVGKRYGTVAFKVDGHTVEVTTFRAEIYEPGSRKPTVEFIDDITHDLSRRDFTINAMALRPNGTLIDLFGGKDDLGNHLIRTVNHAYDRFNEDALRMLRVGRFAAQLGFSIDNEISIQAEKKAVKILEISRERWMQELDKLLTAGQPNLGLHFLSQTRLLHFMLPELAVQVDYNQDSPYHELDLWSHTIKTVRLSDTDVTLRWAALLHDIGKPYVRKLNNRGYSNYTDHEIVGAELITKIAYYLRWSNERTVTVRDLVRQHLASDSPLQAADSAARFGD